MGNTEAKQAGSALRIITVAPDSPAQQAGLTEFLDFILEISGNTHNLLLPAAYLSPTTSPDQPGTRKIKLHVYNILHRNNRTIDIELPESNEPGKNGLGILVREEEFVNAHERILRVVEVYPKSPADLSGLKVNTDYIIGVLQFPFRDISDFADYVSAIMMKNDGEGFSACAYSTETNSIRRIKIIPNKNWGGKGTLGCEFAVGIMNNLPLLKEDLDHPDTLADSGLQVVIGGETKEEKEPEKDVKEIPKERTQEIMDGITAHRAKSSPLIKSGPLIPPEDNKSSNVFNDGSFCEVAAQENIQEDLKSGSDTHVGPILAETENSVSFALNEDKQSTPLFRIESLEKSSGGTPKAATSALLQGNVQTQRASVRLVPKPHLKVQHMDSNSLTGISDISPIINKQSLGTYGATPNSRDNSQITKRAKAASVSQTLVSQPNSPYGWSFPEKDESNFEKRGPSSHGRGKPTRRLTDGSQKGEKGNVKQDEEVVEVYFQGIERVEHSEEEMYEFPKILMTNPDLTNVNTTLLDRSGGESQNKSIEMPEIHEKPVCKTVIQYTFHSKKLGGDYIIKSTDLFSIGDFRKI